MRVVTLLLIASLASFGIAFAAPVGDASPVTACTSATSHCSGIVCVYHNTLAFIENPNCVR